MDSRKTKGTQIAKTCVIERKGMEKWLVPSQSGRGLYTVVRDREGFKCNCPDYEIRQQACKHVYAVEIKVLKWFDDQGNETTVVIKKTYSQNWNAYDKSQIEEKRRFMELLKDLTESIEEPSYNFGRPKAPVRDMLFASGLKVYTQFSLRRFMSDLSIAKEKGFVRHNPSFTAVGQFMQKESLTPILIRLIQLSSTPLRAVEKDFAVDSSGFRTTRFNDYCRETHQTKQKHQWIKCHIMCGVKTNIITAVELGFEHHSADSPQFIPLVSATHNNGFDIQEVSADKAYTSRNNFEAVHQIGGIPYIPFKSNSTQRSLGSSTWRKMFYYFKFYNAEFMNHYHKRSNVETTFFMMKSKFNDMLKSKTRTAQINEMLLKALCHNIVVVIQQVNELGIHADFT